MLRAKLFRIIGVIGTTILLGLYVKYPSWPTPDKFFVLLFFIALMLGKAVETTKRFLPFVALLLLYDSFRGIVPHLNGHVNFGFMPAADKFIFGGHLPTTVLQNLLWHGSLNWYDFVFYAFYMLHFVLPLILALLIWKYRSKLYWRFMSSFIVMSFSGFLIYLAFPAAPPWMASNSGVIEPITRISTYVWHAFGNDFPSVYNIMASNPVAAMPSLHAAYATLLCISVFKIFGKKWGLTSLIYPIMIFIGTVYLGEHYVIDLIAGALLAVLAYKFTPNILQALANLAAVVRRQIIKLPLNTGNKKAAPNL